MFNFKFSNIILKLLQTYFVPNTVVSQCWPSLCKSEWSHLFLRHPRSKSIYINMSSSSTEAFFHHTLVVPQYSLQLYFQVASVIFNITTSQSTKDYYPFTLIRLKRGYWLNLTTLSRSLIVELAKDENKKPSISRNVGNHIKD